MDKLTRAEHNFPRLYKPGLNRVVTSILKTWIQEDERITFQLDEAKKQVFVSLASERYLDILGSNVGVPRPTIYPTQDENYKTLIPALSYYPKQIRKTIYDLFDIYWGLEFSRSTLTSQNYEAYSIYDGTSLIIKIDDVTTCVVTFENSDFVDPMAATVDEIIAKINSYYYPVIAQKYTNIDGKKFLRLSTTTVGQEGSIEITGGDANFALGFYKNRKIQNTKCAVFEINPKELVIKCPDSVPLYLELEGSHHLHEDATIVNTWPGGFLYDTPITTYIYGVSSVSTTLSQEVLAGMSYNKLLVADSSDFPNEEGHLIINFGNASEEKLIPYIKVLSSGSIIISPSYIFENTHSIGDTINLCFSSHVIPDSSGCDYAVYLNNMQVAEQLLIDLLYYVKAAGVILRFELGDLSLTVAEFGPLVTPAWLGKSVLTAVEVAAMTAGWGVGEQGKTWFNLSTKNFEGWDGAAVVIIG